MEDHDETVSDPDTQDNNEILESDVGVGESSGPEENGDESEIEILLKRITHAINNRDSKACQSLLSQIVSLQPAPEVFSLRGDWVQWKNHRERRDFSESLREYQCALLLQPMLANTLFDLGAVMDAIAESDENQKGRGCSQITRENFKEAAQRLLIAARESSIYSEVMYFPWFAPLKLGYVKLDMGYELDSMRTFLEGLEIEPNSRDIRLACVELATRLRNQHKN
eukprot:c8056_g2_i3.p1 GENE.c8056_g2_i3~~c8056_g2_i3.p1  ORF type:complete len:247 (+),score=59.44 c8056_g2_i3:69-743(+)